MPAIVVIPARFGATRFPGKPLASLNGTPIIQHVYENASGASRIDAVFVATDSEQIAGVVRGFGGLVLMTSDQLQSGTDRVADAVCQVVAGGMPLSPEDVIINVQGDEPMMRAEMIDQAVGLMDDPAADIGTLVRQIQSPEDVFNPNVVKAVFGPDGYALYFSRAPLPYHRDLFMRGQQHLSPEEFSQVCMYRHYGIYAFRKASLEKFAALAPTALEQAEKLEQLRALENGMTIRIGITNYDTIGVDTPEDLERVKQWLNISL
jgi:3-deoxy-manno-octulosonate cytidylyltransferase (CMP-KDO synthetase)